MTIFLWRNFSDSYAVLVLYIITQIKEIFKLLWAIGSIWHYGGCLNKQDRRTAHRKTDTRILQPSVGIRAETAYKLPREASDAL